VALSFGAAGQRSTRSLPLIDELESHHMTEPQPSPAPSRRRRLLVGASLVLATLIGAAGPLLPSPVASSASAQAVSARRVADPVAAVAGTALQALNRFARTGDQGTLAQYVALRDDLAAAIAARIGVPAAALSAAWATASVPNQQALMTGLTQLGVPYRSRGTSTDSGFDCSGFTGFSWRGAGVQLPRSSGDQIRAFARRDAATAKAGDLAYYPGHVMLYLGVPGAILHSPRTGDVVKVQIQTRSSGFRFASPVG
jgi:cell wall-associated NlpC family hydrolase